MTGPITPPLAAVSRGWPRRRRVRQSSRLRRSTFGMLYFDRMLDYFEYDEGRKSIVSCRYYESVRLRR
jgi:hypothetical protein